MSHQEASVFIAHPAEDLAAACQLESLLQFNGVKAHRDVLPLGGGGDPDNGLLLRIMQHQTLVLVCSAGCLGGDLGYHSGFRRLVEHAVRGGRLIVPVFMPGFKWASTSPVPPEVQVVRRLIPVKYKSDTRSRIRRYTAIHLLKLLGVAPTQAASGLSSASSSEGVRASDALPRGKLPNWFFAGKGQSEEDRVGASPGANGKTDALKAELDALRRARDEASRELKALEIQLGEVESTSQKRAAMEAELSRKDAQFAVLAMRTSAARTDFTCAKDLLSDCCQRLALNVRAFEIDERRTAETGDSLQRALATVNGAAEVLRTALLRSHEQVREMRALEGELRSLRAEHAKLGAPRATELLSRRQELLRLREAHDREIHARLVSLREPNQTDRRSVAQDGNAPSVFISHSSVDKAAADRLVTAIESGGLRCWVAHRDIAPRSQGYSKAITEALASAKIVVLLVSDAAIESGHVRNEIEVATNRKMAILPVWCEGFNGPVPEDFSYYIQRFQRLVLPKELSQVMPSVEKLLQQASRRN